MIVQMQTIARGSNTSQASPSGNARVVAKAAWFASAS
jgi:hypothetical protein